MAQFTTKYNLGDVVYVLQRDEWQDIPCTLCHGDGKVTLSGKYDSKEIRCPRCMGRKTVEIKRLDPWFADKGTISEISINSIIGDGISDDFSYTTYAVVFGDSEKQQQKKGLVEPILFDNAEDALNSKGQYESSKTSAIRAN